MPPFSVCSRRPGLIVALAGLVTATAAATRADGLGAAAGSPSPQAAPAPPAPSADLQNRVRELEETVRQLQETIRQLPQGQPASGQPAVQPSDVQKIVDERLKQSTPFGGTRPLAGWQDGFFLRSPDGSFLLKIRGYMQADSRWFPSNAGETGPNSFYLRRARPIFEGTVYKNFDFRLMPDFGQGKSVLQDAYLNLRLSPEFQIQAGKYKEPVSLERLQSGSELLFVDRSIANNLAPNRDAGAMLHGDLSGDRVSYALGVFNGVLDGGSSDGDDEDSKDVAARLFLQPFKVRTRSALQGLAFGIGGSIGRRRGSLSSLAYKTAGQSTFFKYDSAAVGAGDHRRWAPQLDYYQGPFGLLAEYVHSDHEVRKGAAKADLGNHSWIVQGSYVLTGEEASYRNVAPARPFDPKSGQWGAFELAARISELHVDPDAFRLSLADPTTSAGNAHAYTLGLNWYLNRAVKAQFNYERTVFDRSIKFGSGKRDHEDTFLTELQLAF